MQPDARRLGEMESAVSKPGPPQIWGRNSGAAGDRGRDKRPCWLKL